ncbi:MAG: glutamate--tRNA ligase [archaeon]
MMQKKIEELSRRFALQNAAQHGGKASRSAVLGSVLGSLPEARKDVPATMKIIEEIISEINSMTLVEQQKEIHALKIDTAPQKKEKELLKDLPDVGKSVVMRFAPNPNGPLSLGHSRQALLNWFYVKRYKGKYILRLDDTDPKIKIPIKEAYDWIVEDLAWLGIKPDLIVRASSRFDIYYDYAEKLIGLGGAYVCTCPQETFRDLKKKAICCPCRDLGQKEQLARWKNMFSGYKEGEAVLRIKTDILHKNPAIRDWPAFRIVEKPQHPLVNYRVWPLYDYASALDDHLLGVTHLIRGIDFLATKEKQGYLYKYFNWKYPKDLVTGKLLVVGIKSTSESRKLITEGKLSGWDDPRLGTLRALKRRGFSPQAIINFISDIGVKKSDIKVSEKNLYSYNRKIIDSISPRYFFTEDPVGIDISKAPRANTALTIKGAIPAQEDRIIKVRDSVYIAKKDFDRYKGKKVRLKEFAYGILDKTFTPENDSEFDKDRSNVQVIQWVEKDDCIDLNIVMPDSTIIKGKAEQGIQGLNNQVVQFERVGFVNLVKEKGSKKITGFFAHP